MDKYGTKHQPATPLPWTVTLGETAGSVHSPIQSAPVAGTIRGKDAAYITHAANAYPKLVASLKDVLASLQSVGYGDDEAAALLRVLGEDK